MGRDQWDTVRSRRTPWGAIALVMLTGLALMRNGVETSAGPPQPAAAASAAAPHDAVAAAPSPTNRSSRSRTPPPPGCGSRRSRWTRR